MEKMKETEKFKEIDIFKAFKVIVFDMDGTLYQLDGEDGTFKNSTLSNTVIANSVQLVIDKEGCSAPAAKNLIAEALKDSIGISNVLSKRFGITRSQVFDLTWNIDPKFVIKNFDIPKLAVQKLRLDGKRLFLLTAAPRIWMENVMTKLALGENFERKIHGEMFGSKTEIFESLAKEFRPETILSIGDQFKADLKPAQALGMSIFEIKDPNDFEKLI